MTRALVVYCHPLEESFVAAVRDQVVGALLAAGAEVRIEDLHADGFDPALSAAEQAQHRQPGADPSLDGYVEDLQWCDMLVFVYPTWWAGQPAMLKGWIDRVWACGVAFTLDEDSGRLRRGLRNVRRLVAVTTHGSPKYVNAIEGEGGKRTMTRSLRAMCHPLARTSWVAMYGVDTSTPEQRQRYLDRVAHKIRRLAD